MSDAPSEALTAAGFAALTDATPAQMQALQVLQARLAEWNARMNLVGPSTLPQFWSRHAWDSAQLLPLEPEALTWADLGAGAGFPGLVLAILLRDRPGAHVHLVESLGKRCRFLQAVVEELALPATVHNARAESLSLAVDVVTARAVAPLTRLLEYAEPYFNRGARGVFLKSADVAEEIADARKTWGFDAAILTSRSDSRGRILRIERLVRGAKSKAYAHPGHRQSEGRRR
jgi:16S rRNA (guanine527-N7)-methyltransferase